MSHLSRRDFLRFQGALGLAALTGATVPALQRRPDVTSGLPVYDVTDYGAFANGTDATDGFRRAIAAAQADPVGAILKIPAGTFIFQSRVAGDFSASVQIHKLGKPIVVMGAGMGATTLLQQVPRQTLVSVHTDGTTVQDLTLDCQSYQGGPCFGVGSIEVDGVAVGGNNTTLQNVTALGSSGAKAFTLSYPGPRGASEYNLIYNTGNQVLNCVIHDQIADDGFSYSFQNNGLIENITHFGSRLALFMCENVEVTNYDYSMNPYCDAQDSPQGYVTNGFWITPPANNITITNFTTSGEGGIISGPVQERVATNITIVNEKFTGDGYALQVGNVAGLTIENSSFVHMENGKRQINSLIFYPGPPGSRSELEPGGPYPKGATGVVVQNSVLGGVEVSTIPNNQDSGKPSYDNGPALVEASFVDCVFSPLHGPTFVDRPISVWGPWDFTGPSTFFLKGGKFENQAQGVNANVASGVKHPIKKCVVNGNEVEIQLDSALNLAVGETVEVSGITGFTADPPNGRFVITGLNLRTSTLVFDVPTPPTGSYKGGGNVTGVATPPVLNVLDCTAAGTTVTLTLNSSLVLAEGELVVVAGIEGFAGQPPNGTFTVTGTDDTTNRITLTTSAPLSGSYAGGGTVTGTMCTLTTSGLPPIYLAAPVISGTPLVGDTVTASPGTWVEDDQGPPSFAYQWDRNGTPIASATTPSYTCTSLDGGQQLSVTVTATNATGTTSVTSASVVVHS